MKRLLPILLLLGALRCGTNNVEPEIRHSYEKFSVPSGNPLTSEKIELGKRLFFEKGLSLDSSVSCTSCHMQQFAFADTARVSTGFHGQKGFRNSPSLANLAFHSRFFYDGQIASLERAIHPPLITDVEMNMNAAELDRRLEQNPTYQKLFQKAFQKAPNYTDAVRALASYLRTLVSQNAAYDNYYMGDKNALTESQKRGLALFKSEKLNCAKCHVPPFFTDNEIHNIGLDSVYEDYGFGRVTRKEKDFGKMKTPALRNVAVTAPYMHNGSLQTLAEVLDFYAAGGKEHPNKSPVIQPFSITETEKQDVINFLVSLTDSAFLQNTAYQPEK